MKKFCITNMTEQDIAWLRLMLRNEFDKPREPWQYQQVLDIIHRTERFGFIDLAEEMKSDFNSKPYEGMEEEVPTREQVTGEPSINASAERKMNIVL